MKLILKKTRRPKMQEFKNLEKMLGSTSKKEFRSGDKVITVEIKYNSPTPIPIPNGVWQLIDKRINFIVMSEKNYFMAFEKEPKLNEFINTWEDDDENCDYCFNTNWVNIDTKGLDWKKSLTKRPDDEFLYANGYINSDIWEMVDEDFKYMAIDANGDIYLYKYKPELKDDHWDADDRDEDYEEISEYVLNINTDNIDWRYSLVKRPD